MAQFNFQSVMRISLFIILISAIIPATWLLVLSFLAFYYLIPNAEFSVSFFGAICSILMGVLGYIGLFLLLNGLHKTNHRLKLVLLANGLIGFCLSMKFLSIRNFKDWLFEFNLEILIGKWPLLVSLFFVILILINSINERKLSK
ncbi:MAG: hypothetical protein ACPG6V_11335 [Flavobacteriales bacterium]